MMSAEFQYDEIQDVLILMLAKNGVDGKDGKSMLSGTSLPANTVGADGDFFMDTAHKCIYGPKAGGARSASAVVAFTSVRYGASAPISSIGIDGDFYIETTNSRMYGPKASGAWPS